MYFSLETNLMRQHCVTPMMSSTGEIYMRHHMAVPNVSNGSMDMFMSSTFGRIGSSMPPASIMSAMAEPSRRLSR